MMTRAASLPDIECRRPCSASGQSGRQLILGLPAIAESIVGLDLLERSIHRLELLAHPFDGGTHIGAIAVGTLAGDEALAFDDVVELPVADVRPGRGGE